MIKDEFRRLCYRKWNSMKQRCGTAKGYVGVTICDEWNNFENFYQWMLKKKSSCEYVDGWEIDKDVLQPLVKHKVYSPNTCIFIPNNINCAIVGIDVYSHKPSNCLYWDKNRNKWQVKLKMYNKTIHLGRFEDKIDGFVAYINAKIKYMQELIDKEERLSTNNKDKIMYCVKTNLNYRLEQLKEVKKCINNTD